MKMSQLFGKTLREAPTEAEQESHRLLLRAGLVQQLAAGIYSYLPTGLRVQRKIDQIVREEMDRAGGQEVLMPVLSPAELWQETGRLQTMQSILFTLEDRRERRMVLGPTHEEIIIDLFRRSVQSYKELPQLLYQIQTKFRDEPRPRMGLIRGREFEMMDLYSFHADSDDLDRAYQTMYEAYERVFQRLGLPAVAVFADSGAIGGKESQEFLLLSDIGEDEAFICPSCGYAANKERAEIRKSASPFADPQPLEDVSTPGQKTIDELVRFLGVKHEETLKAVFYMATFVAGGASGDGRGGTRYEPVFVAIRGDFEVNEIKLLNALKANDVRAMSEEEVRAAGLVAGSASPIGLTGMRIVADDSVLDSPNLIAGANRPDMHLRNVNYGRDWQAEIVTDLALARPGDACVRCGTPLEVRRGIEMGHIFKLGTIWSEKMGAKYLDAEGREQITTMGCYGIGTSRLLHCIVEANRDEKGIVWPASVAPYDVHLVGIGLDRDGIADQAGALSEELTNAGLDVLYDDRLEATAGVKFNDADLLGLPVRVTISPRSLEKGGVELKLRDATEAENVPLDDIAQRVREVLNTSRR